MKRSNKRRQQLCYTVSDSTFTSKGNVPQAQHRVNKGNGATKLIITVVVLFVFTTLPQGILNLLAGISETVFYRFYAYLGDLMDDLTLINSAVNFLIYCIMSKNFRNHRRIMIAYKQHSCTAYTTLKIINQFKVNNINKKKEICKRFMKRCTQPLKPITQHMCARKL
ncbi:hypothetical protein KUTeg_012664 [Tegillarca granosa]|uniref:G-protein coupled receptors family 1 profile domain-containing protein n=1 Tax=Tegillarca granosa TaxID=220873 RepID=A0ABQ9F0E3_TEGGR|nr:hypothetical protein KUTeg_012664 [Tegillarca granosa]